MFLYYCNFLNHLWYPLQRGNLGDVETKLPRQALSELLQTVRLKISLLNTSNAAAYGELGLTDLEPLIAKKIAKDWIWLHLTNCPPLLSDALALQIQLTNCNGSWMHDWKQLLLTYNELSASTTTYFPDEVFERIADVAIQKWHCDLQKNNKLRFYRSFKSTLTFEIYLTCIKDIQDCVNLCKLRAHKLSQQGHHYNPPLHVIPTCKPWCNVNLKSKHKIQLIKRQRKIQQQYK